MNHIIVPEVVSVPASNAVLQTIEGNHGGKQNVRLGVALARSAYENHPTIRHCDDIKLVFVSFFPEVGSKAIIL